MEKIGSRAALIMRRLEAKDNVGLPLAPSSRP